ncbi:MAG: sulfite exporter TauE/SafE family protein [Burkholderiales bacterium]|nr:sulfite exporter TauE/SafE family protein [Burkholderiales bacterium]
MPDASPLSSLPTTLLILSIATFALAGVVKGVVGLGLPTVAMAVLALAMTPADAAALLVVPSLVTNFWQMRPWPAMWPLLRRLLPMQAGVVAGTLFGAWLLGAPAGAWARAALGVALLGYAAWSLLGSVRPVAPRTERWLGPLTGAITGIVTAATGVFAVPAVPYLQALGLPRAALMQAMGLSFSVSTAALALGLQANGRFPTAALGLSLVMLAPALLGMLAGQWLGQRLSPAVFRRCFLLSMAALGLYMVLRELI